MKYKYIKVVIVFLFMWASLNAVYAEKLSVNGHDFEYTVPKDFVDLESFNINIFNQMKASLGNKLCVLKVYVPRSEMYSKDIMKALVISYDPHFEKPTPMNFVHSKKLIRKQFELGESDSKLSASLTAKAMNRLKSSEETNDLTADIKYSSEGIEYEDSNIISGLFKQNITIAYEDESALFYKFSRMMSVYVKNTIFVLSASYTVLENNDTQWGKKELFSLAEELISKNSSFMDKGSDLISPDTALSDFTEQLFNVKFNQFSTKDLKNSQGINVIMKIPENWKSSTGNLANTVQLFESQPYDNNMLASIKIHIYDCTEEYRELFVHFVKNRDNCDIKLLKSLHKSDENVIRGGITNIGNLDAIWSETTNNYNIANFSFGTRYLDYNMLVNDKIVCLTFGVTGVGCDKEDDVLKAFYDAYLPLFQVLAASAFIM